MSRGSPPKGEGLKFSKKIGQVICEHFFTECAKLNQHVNKLKGSQRKNSDDVPDWTIHDINLFPWNGGMPERCKDGKDGKDSWAGQGPFNGHPSISTKLLGKGRAILKFGNCHKNGKVTLYKNGIELKTVGDFSDAEVEFEYENQDEIKIASTGYAIIKFKNFEEFSCLEKNFCGPKTGKQFRNLAVQYQDILS